MEARQRMYCSFKVWHTSFKFAKFSFLNLLLLVIFYIHLRFEVHLPEVTNSEDKWPNLLHMVTYWIEKKKQDTFSVTFTSVICNVEYFAVVAENGILLLSSFQFWSMPEFVTIKKKADWAFCSHYMNRAIFSLQLFTQNWQTRLNFNLIFSVYWLLMHS